MKKKGSRDSTWKPADTSYYNNLPLSTQEFYEDDEVFESYGGRVGKLNRSKSHDKQREKSPKKNPNEWDN
ncbi:MAG: hypothetical protein NWE76_01930 [Candidatus Bathyarchaeota archaeon]|nr:hypothetical protein [Candidatus Bathyarchaeota archaeon]